MKFLFLLSSLVMSVLTISCTSNLNELTDQNAVSDAWLDTAPRVSQRPHRPADGITHWKYGPSMDRITTYSPRSKPARSAQPAEVASSKQKTTRPETHYISSGYTTHYGASHRGHHRAPNQGFVRTVEQVGPSIVPRLSVPTVVRSPQAVSTRNHSSNNKESHRSGYNRGERNTASTAANGARSRGGQGSREGRRR
jgi:hypothetical protein